MKVFQGDLFSPDFQQWFARESRDRVFGTVIVTDCFPCYKAQTTIGRVKNIPSGSLNCFPWLLEDIKEAMLHLATCQQSEKCKRLLQRLVQENS